MQQITKEPNMKKILMMAFIVTGVSTSWLWAEKDLSAEIRKVKQGIEQLKKENRKLDQEIGRIDSLKTEEAARFSQLKKNYARDLERRQSEIAELKSKMKEIQKKIQDEQRAQTGFQNRMDNTMAREKSLAAQLVRHCKILEEAVGHSLPWEKETRLERIRVLRRDLEAGNAEPEEGFNRLNALYTSEIASGDEVAIFDKPVTRNNGEVINASVLKIGNQWMVYVDEENRYYGILERAGEGDDIKYSWREELSFNEREAVRDALDVKFAKKPPKLVNLPLTLTTEKAKTMKGEE
jgi:hypothetical protein